MLRIVQIQVTNGQLLWNVARTESGTFIAVCHPLGLTMQGDSLDDLYANINDSVQLLMRDLLEAGELDTFLRKRGWTMVQPVGTQGPDEVEFDVPIGLAIGSRDQARALLQ